MDTPAPPPVTSARTLGPYRLMESVGLGPRGTVYRATDSRSGAEVALKLFAPEVVPADAPPEAAAAEKARVEQLLEGARLAAKLKHPSIVPVLDVGLEAGSPFVVRAFLRAVPIDRWSRGAVYNPAFTSPAGKGTSRPSGIGPAFGPPPTLPDILTALYHACRAVDAGHDQGLLHGNLRPENILVDGDGRPHLTDFALPPDVPEDALTASPALLDGVAYHAPEVLLRRGSPAMPSRDVYSLGAILYELLCERPPFADPDPSEVLRRASLGGPPPPSATRVSVHQDLDAICLKAMAREPRRRFQTVKELAAALDRFLHHERLAIGPSAAERVIDAVTRPRSMVAIAVATIAVGLAVGSLFSQLAAVREEASREARVRPHLRQARALVEMAEGTSSGDVARTQAAAALPAVDHALAEGGGAEALALRARAKRILGDWEAADSAAREALATDPSHPDALAVRAEAAVWRALLDGTWPEAACRWAATAGYGIEEVPPFPRGPRGPSFQGQAGIEAQEALRALRAGCLREDLSHWVDGWLAWTAGDVTKAHRELDEGMARNPALPILRLSRCALFLSEGQGAAAIADIEVAERGAPTSCEALLLGAIAHGMSGDAAGAERSLAELEGLRPGWRTARRARAYLRVAAGNLVGAREDAEALVAAEDAPPAHLLLAWVRALGEDASAAKGIDDACLRWPSEVDLLYVRTWLLWRRGDAGDAIRATADLLSAAPDLPEALYLSAVMHLSLDEGEAALGACNRILERDPAWRGPRATRARALVALGREEEALLSLDEVLAAAPGDATFQGLRAEALLHRAMRRRDLKLRSQDLDDALAAADLAVAAAQGRAQPLVLRSRVREERANDAGAEADLAEAEKAAPKDSEPFRARAAYMMRRGRQADALAALNAAAARSATDAEVLRDRAAVYVALGQQPMALKDLDALIALRPFDALGYAERGKLLLAAGEKEKARADLTHALEVGKHRKDLGAVKELLDSIR